MEIKIMTIADYDEVYKLWINTKGMGLNNLDDSRDGIEHFLKRNPNSCFTATEDNKLVGVILAGHDGRRGYIYHTAVSENCRFKGIGKRLVNESLKALRANGINKVAVVVFEKNETGNAFWEKIGFKQPEDVVYRNIALTELKRIDT